MTDSSETDELPIRVESESGAQLVWADVNDLRELVNRIGGNGDHFLIVSPVPFRPRRFIQTYRNPDDFSLEYREEYQQFGTRVTDPESVVSTMVAWALNKPDWKSGHAWELAVEHTPAEVPPLDAEAADYAREVAERSVAEGSDGFEEIVRAMTESAEPDNPVSEAQAEAMLEPLWLARVAEQESWPETTDADRLEEVFDGLDAAGITARMNFACCQRCGIGEIRGEAAEGDRGFVFYHQQDADRLVEGSVHLAFGAYSKVDEVGIALGRDIVEALATAGFTTDWDGTISKRIQITGLDWRKRLE